MQGKCMLVVWMLLAFCLRCTALASVYHDINAASLTANDSHHPIKVVECSAVRGVNSSLQCNFVKKTSGCHYSSGFVQYNDFIYCQLANHHAAALLVLALLLMYLFVALGVTADEFFCPCLKTFARTLRMSDSVAGVTLLALGNGAPDIFSVLAAITTNDQDTAPLAFQELFGSGMFVTTVVVGCVQLKNSFKLARRPFLRDVIFYICAVGWTFAVIYRKDIQTAEAVGFIVLYVIYVTLVIAGQAVNRTMRSSNLTEDQPTFSVNDGDIQSQSRHVKRAIIEDLHANADFTVFEPSDRSLLIHNPHAYEQTIPAISDSIQRIEDSASFDDGFVCDENFIERIVGINVKEWKLKPCFWKVFDVIKVPLELMLNTTNPVIDVDEQGLKWNKWLTVLQCVVSPVACAFITKNAFVVVYNTFVVWEALLIIGAILALIVIVTTAKSRPPKFFPIFAVVGFVASVIWIYALAQEIVNLLMAFGVSFGLSNAVLGLTLLAWGNSIGDFISNMTMARKGAPRMAIAACYGGPLLNMMLGVGISCTISSLTHNGDVKFIRGNIQYIISAAFLGVSLATALFLMPILKFGTNKLVGIFLILLYVAYLSVSIVNELHLFPGSRK